MLTGRVVKVLLSGVAVGVALLGYVQTATAALLRWNLQNVTFTDGTVASGFFSWDTQAEGPFANFDVKLTGGKYPSFEYTPRNSSGFSQQGGAVFSTATRHLYLRTFDTFTNNGFTKSGTHRLSSARDGNPNFDTNFLSLSFEADDEENQSGFNPARWVRSGSVTTGIPKPEPHGALVRWTLDGVKFDNGGTATGSFVYDASAGTVVDFDIHPDGLCAIFSCSDGVSEEINEPYDFQPTYIWRPGVSAGPSPGTLSVSFSHPANPSAAKSLDFLTGKPLTDSGGTVPLIVGGGDVNCCGNLTGSQAICCYGQVHSSLIAGALIGTLVPEPSETLFLALGLAAVVGFSARRKR